MLCYIILCCVNFFESGVVKIQQGRALDLKETEKHAC